MTAATQQAFDDWLHNDKPAENKHAEDVANQIRTRFGIALSPAAIKRFCEFCKYRTPNSEETT